MVEEERCMQGMQSVLKEVVLQARYTSPRCQEAQMQELLSLKKKKKRGWRGLVDTDEDPNMWACGRQLRKQQD